MLEKLPAGAYTCDPDGLITYFNQSAVRLWGRAPGLNDPSDRYCGSFRLFGSDGRPIAHDQCWMALALKTDSEYNRREIVIERPDGRRFTALAHANPIHDESGELLGAVNVLVDITERKRTEEERDRIFDLSPDLLCVAGLDGYFKRVNPAFEETLGYTREELLARPFVDFVHPDDRAATLGELERLATGSPTLRFENRYLRKDGSHAWLAWKAVPVTEDGLVYAAARDVTEQKRSEEELRSAELFARSTLNSLSANIAILDETGVIVATNKAWREFGVSNEAPVTARVGEGANYLRVCDGASGEGSEGASAFAAGIRDVISGRRETFESEYPCHSPAEERWFVGRVMRFPDTRPPKVVVAHENITGRKRSEEEIRTRARQQAALARLGQRALAQSNLAITMHEAAAMLADTLSADRCEVLELLPDGEAWLLRAGVGWGEEAEAVLDPQARYALRSGEPVIVEDLREDGRFGGPPPGDLGALSGISVVIPGRDGPFGVLGAHTRERRVFTADDANLLRAAANVLAAAVERRRTEEEMHQVREAERRRIARDMHDDALQDLTYVLAETQLIRDMSEDPRLDDRLRRAVEALKRTGQGLRAAIFDLRLGEDPDFVAQLEALVDLNRRYTPDLEVEFVVQGDFRPPLDDARQTELLRIVQEALANARRHSEASRVRVVVGVTGDGVLRAEVSDDGRGFAAATPVGLGTRGMRERARALGGDLRITSKPGEGTTVRFEMGFGEVAGGSGQRTRVLLVEDHASLREAVAALLDREPDLTVVGQAGTLAQARGMLEGVDVAVIDLALPDGRGTELIREMREVDPRTQAIVLSAYSDRAEVALAVESGAAGVLHKSAGVGEVADAVRRLRAGESLLALEEVVDLLRFAGSHRDQEHEAQQAIARLTPREKEVLAAVAEGLDGKEISERLNISLRTERNHMANILSKLGVNSRLQALVFALRHGLVEVT